MTNLYAKFVLQLVASATGVSVFMSVTVLTYGVPMLLMTNIAKAQPSLAIAMAGAASLFGSLVAVMVTGLAIASIHTQPKGKTA